ncbi:MAG TPA: hypothetical protein VLB02_00170 [Candidatus Paceibacterota bacterium]|nr:hypothetical protein [Candidatus Paceibacterota bacterium]
MEIQNPFTKHGFKTCVQKTVDLTLKNDEIAIITLGASSRDFGIHQTLKSDEENKAIDIINKQPAMNDQGEEVIYALCDFRGDIISGSVRYPSFFR